MSKITIFNLAASAFVVCNLSCADAASIVRDDNGNVVVEAYGEKMKFIGGQAEHIVLSFMASKCDQKPRQYLRDVIDNKDIIECVTSDERATTASHTQIRSPDVFAIIPVSADKLNTIYASAVRGLPTANVTDAVIASAMTPSLSVMIHPANKWPHCIVSSDSISDILNYQRRDVATNPKGLQFSLASSHRDGKLAQPLCISCNPLSAYSTLPGSRWLCAITEVSSDGGASVSFRWLTPDFPKPSRDWSVFDSFARSVASKLFSDRNIDDFQ
jgi:hypothetical protein